MDVSLTNEVNKKQVVSVRVHSEIQGPVTFTIDSRKFEYVNSSIKNSKDSSRIDLAQQQSSS